MNDEALKWNKTGERRLLDTPIFSVMGQEETAANGITGEYISLEAPDCVVIVPVYGEDFVLVRQWRHGAGKLTTEFPGGVVDRGEDPEAAALRELREETGFEAGRISLLGVVSPNPAIFRSRFFCYLAEELEPTGVQHLDRDELISVFTRPVGEVIEGFGSEEYCHAFMGAALAFYLRNRGN